MAEGKKLPTVETVELGAFNIPADWLREQAPQEFNKRGAVLASERQTVHIMVDGRPVKHTLSLYVQRDPLGDDEQERIAMVAAERKAAADEKAAKEQATREREIARAVALTKDVTFDAMARATAHATEAARAIETLNKLGVKVGQ